MASPGHLVPRHSRIPAPVLRSPTTGWTVRRAVVPRPGRAARSCGRPSVAWVEVSTTLGVGGRGHIGHRSVRSLNLLGDAPEKSQGLVPTAGSGPVGASTRDRRRHHRSACGEGVVPQAHSVLAPPTRLRCRIGGSRTGRRGRRGPGAVPSTTCLPPRPGGFHVRCSADAATRHQRGRGSGGAAGAVGRSRPGPPGAAGAPRANAPRPGLDLALVDDAVPRSARPESSAPARGAAAELGAGTTRHPRGLGRPGRCDRPRSRRAPGIRRGDGGMAGDAAGAFVAGGGGLWSLPSHPGRA